LKASPHALKTGLRRFAARPATAVVSSLPVVAPAGPDHRYRQTAWSWTRSAAHIRL